MFFNRSEFKFDIATNISYINPKQPSIIRPIKIDHVGRSSLMNNVTQPSDNTIMENGNTIRFDRTNPNAY